MWLGLHWQRARAAPLLCGMLVGVATLAGSLLAARSFTALVHGVHPGVLGLGGNLVTVYLATLAGRWRKRRRAAQHGSKLADEPTPSLVITPPLADKPTAAIAAAFSAIAASPTAAAATAAAIAAATAAATTRTADGPTPPGGPPFASVEEELFASRPSREPARAWCGAPWAGAAIFTLASSTFWRQGGEQDAVLWMLPRWADLSNAATLLLGMGACVATYYGWEVTATEEGRGPHPGQAVGCCRRRRTAPAAPAAPAVAVELVRSASGRSAEGADEWQAI